MPVIDEKGRLFGRVNVIDALVVLVVVAVGVAGVALVMGLGEEGPTSQPINDTGPDPSTRYATVSLGAHPSWVASGIEAGQSVSVDGSDQQLSVTDVYLTGSNGSDGVGVVVSVSYPDGFTANDRPLRAGESVTLATDDLRTDGQILATGRNQSSLPAETSSVVLTATVEEATADAVRPGDRLRVGGRTVATVERVASAPVSNGTRRLTLGASLSTLALGDERRFAGRPLRVGAKLPFRTDGIDGFTGQVTAVDSLGPPGEPANVTVTVAWEDVRPETAEELRAGLRESHRGASARVVAVDSEPATVVRPDSEGALRVREHPRNRDVTVTVRATARRMDSGLRFHGRPLADGRPVTLEFGTVTVDGTVLDVDTDE